MIRHGKQVFEGDWTDASGRRCRRILGANRRDAERALTKVIRDRDLELAGLVVHQGVDRPVLDVLGAYLSDLRSRAKERTIHDAEVTLKRIQAYLRPRVVRDLTKPRVLEYRLRRLQDGVSHKTINTEVATLQAALNLAVRHGDLSSNPLAGLRALPVTAEHRRRLPRALQDNELGRLLKCADDLDREQGGMPRAPLLRTLIATGARWAELACALWADLDVERNLLSLRPETTKTKAARVIPLDPDLVEVLLELRAEQTRILAREPLARDPIFLTPGGSPWQRNGNRFRHYLAVVCARAGIEKCDPSGRVVHIHALRHTFVTRCARAGVPIQVAMKLSGHKTVQLLQSVYTHLEVEDARAAIESLPKLRARP